MVSESLYMLVELVIKNVDFHIILSRILELHFTYNLFL
jgi:hypothetical protein